MVLSSNDSGEPCGPSPSGARSWSLVRVVPEVGSTNDVLVAALAAEPEAWPHGAVLRAEHQSAGRGRRGRDWQTPPGQALTASVVLRPPPERPRGEWPTLGMLAGLAVVRTLAERGADAALKWPNDVVLTLPGPDDERAPGWGPHRKVGGLLAEVAGGAVVLGIGVNVAQRQVPVPWATSLALQGIAATPAEVLDAIGVHLARLWGPWAQGGFTAIRTSVLERMTTLGREVEIDLGGERVRGRARDLDDLGRLLVVVDGVEQAYAAGDIRHLRT